jgi:cysteine synthase A
MDAWVSQAITKIEADMQRSSDTHLVPVPLPRFDGIQLYLKDESTHPTGSLKHRLARSLFLFALCNGEIKKGSTVIEASSGSTAISEAYFARLLGLPFIAVVPESTSVEKIRQIEFYGGQSHKVKGSDIYSAAEALAQQTSGVYLDQFTNAERATDWRGNNNIAESIFKQMEKEPHPIPRWVVVTAGTGGTSATIGRYIRYKGLDTQLCVPDPDNSVFYDYFQTGDKTLRSSIGSNIEGIGRPRVEPSFLRKVVDRMYQIPDAASYASMHYLNTILNRRCGGSTGTNFYTVLMLIEEMKNNGESGSIVSMICDSGERYLNSYYSEAWLAEKGFLDDVKIYQDRITKFINSGAPLK